MSTTSTGASCAMRAAALGLAALLAPALAACPRASSPASSSPPSDASAIPLDAASSPSSAATSEADAGAPDATPRADAGAPGAAAPADAGAPDAGPPADAGISAARPSEPPRALEARFRALAADAEPRALVRGGANEDVSPDSRFEVDLPRLADFRVRLLDEGERAVESTDRASLTERLRYELAPEAPLTPGSRYALVVDGLRAELATDEQGRAYELLRLELRTSGEKPRAPSKRPKSGKSRRRGR